MRRAGGNGAGGAVVTAAPEQTQVYEIDIPMVQEKGGLKLVPPLTANQRLHHMAAAKRVRLVREGVMLAARAAKIPKAEHLIVQLHYAPGDNRRRDDDNLWPTMKAACDALARGKRRDWVGLELVPDDTPRYMTKLSPQIHPGKGPRRLWISVVVGFVDRCLVCRVQYRRAGAEFCGGECQRYWMAAKNRAIPLEDDPPMLPDGTTFWRTL